ncbi:hypothetical protein BJV82DRAFT_663473 [Fennellomyces sp. T-0311]|nr:hypothetical protein BJV82DRAFT_663473 [Fennellomyces sp. T-0311]
MPLENEITEELEKVIKKPMDVDADKVIKKLISVKEKQAEVKQLRASLSRPTSERLPLLDLIPESVVRSAGYDSQETAPLAPHPTTLTSQSDFSPFASMFAQQHIQYIHSHALSDSGTTSTKNSLWYQLLGRMCKQPQHAPSNMSSILKVAVQQYATNLDNMWSTGLYVGNTTKANTDDEEVSTKWFSRAESLRSRLSTKYEAHQEKRKTAKPPANEPVLEVIKESRAVDSLLVSGFTAEGAAEQVMNNEDSDEKSNSDEEEETSTIKENLEQKKNVGKGPDQDPKEPPRKKQKVAKKES